MSFSISISILKYFEIEKYFYISSTLKMQKCRECKTDKPLEEYYDRHKKCKVCVIKRITDNHKENHSPSVERIKCMKCKADQPISFYEISKKTGLFKDVCKGCKKNHPFNEERYDQVEEWFKEISKVFGKDDLQILKHIILNF